MELNGIHSQHISALPALRRQTQPIHHIQLADECARERESIFSFFEFTRMLLAAAIIMNTWP